MKNQQNFQRKFHKQYRIKWFNLKISLIGRVIRASLFLDYFLFCLSTCL